MLYAEKRALKQIGETGDEAMVCVYMGGRGAVCAPYSISAHNSLAQSQYIFYYVQAHYAYPFLCILCTFTLVKEG